MISASVWTTAAADPVVVELFTSQGCNSCPPADSLLGELAAQEDVIALSLHVDYWDYLGWKDPFAQRVHTERQVKYRDKAGARSIYTPQMVIQGADHLVGSRRAQVLRSIDKHQKRATRNSVDVSVDGGSLVVTVTPRKGRPGQGQVWLVGYDKAKTVHIKRGENRGRKITYHNVVANWVSVGEWNGRAETFKVPKPDNDGVAVIVQSGEVGPVLGAARLEF
jgi:hypothetical protein